MRPILSIKPIRWVFFLCHVRAGAGLTSCAARHAHVSLASPSSRTARSRTGIEGGIDSAGVVVDVGAGEGTDAGVGESARSGGGVVAFGDGIVDGKGAAAGAIIGVAGGGGINT